ncbi:MAG: hypothetical protein DRI84_04540 [Bacteroidetes bacterium]|nr:MAG: hypothetical protein DRI84_04540 [Bacteroidota bacterium]
MANKINFKTGLLYLYWLMSGADGQKNFDPEDPEWKTMRMMREHEEISDRDFDSFINLDLGTPDEQLEKVVSSLNNATHAQKVRSLAWMDLVMIADGNIHSKEHELYTKVRQRFNLEEDEIKKDRLSLPSI